MIKLATPISTLFDGKEAEESIVELSDCLECRDRSVASLRDHQELFHFEAELIHKWSDAERTFIQSAILDRPDLQFVTFHAASCCSDPILDGYQYGVGGTIYSREQMLDNALENIKWLRSFIPSSIEIGIENNNYYPTPAYDHVTDGDFLSEIVTTNNIRFLFDIAHAYVTAHNKNISYKTYVESLPLHVISQVHVCKSGIGDGDIAVDLHLPPDEKELSEVQALVQKHPSLRYVTIEYYQDVSILLAILREYRDALH